MYAGLGVGVGWNFDGLGEKGGGGVMQQKGCRLRMGMVSSGGNGRLNTHFWCSCYFSFSVGVFLGRVLIIGIIIVIIITMQSTRDYHQLYSSISSPLLCLSELVYEWSDKERQTARKSVDNCESEKEAASGNGGNRMRPFGSSVPLPIPRRDGRRPWAARMDIAERKRICRQEKRNIRVEKEPGI